MPPRHAMLVIGYGNDLRSDDGAGIRAATMIAAQSTQSPQSRVIITHQLTPDLAEAIAAAAQVVFIDAYSAPAGGAQLRVERISGETGSTQVLGHHDHPARLMQLASKLFGTCPEAWLVGIPGFNFDVGESISSPTLQMIDEAVALIGERAFVKKWKGDHR